MYHNPMETFQVKETQGTVLCCLCGTMIAPNPSNMCVSCIRTQIDISEGLSKQVTILFCRECERYLQPPRAWIKAQLESKELLTFCIKRIKNLTKVKLIDAGFIWTEPHSKRIKLKITIQKEVMNGAILQQTFEVEFVVEDHMCDQCSRLAANPDQWIAVVQVRQKVDHKKTFLFLEQLILKHGADAHTVNIKQLHEGLDFFYGNRSHALKFVDFLNSVVPIQHRHDKQLVSHDSKSNTYNYKFTFSAEICPICKDDLICLPRKVSTTLGNIGPLVLCLKVSNSILLFDFQTLRYVYLDATQYWRHGFRSLLSSKQLVEYVILDIEPLGSQGFDFSGKVNAKFSLAEAQLARTSDFGKNDTIFTVKTHLGNLLNPGDKALGYDLYGANLNNDDYDKYPAGSFQDVVLVKKSYESRRQKKRGKARPWKLKSLPMEVDVPKSKLEEEKEIMDRERFFEELEEDADLRSSVAIYKNANYIPAPSESDAMTEGDEEEESPPEIPLEELLSELQLKDDRDDEDEDDIEMKM